MGLRIVCFAVVIALLCAADASADKARGGWVHPLVVDHGIRADRAGRGHFAASRYHGRHNGLDLVAPIGTDIVAPCSGRARGGRRGSFGNYVHMVCKVPDTLSGEDPVYASLFFAHLQHKNVPHRKWADVTAGAKVGAVGKTGNAKSDAVMPHLHFEIILHDTEQAAIDERHGGKNQSNTAAADRFFDKLETTCTSELGFSSKGPWRRARRADPFAVLTCLAANKPPLTEPGAPLGEAWRKWSSHYSAKTFDVDKGRKR